MIGAGDPDTVKLYLRVTGRAGTRMPPAAPLAAEQIAILKAWIEQGAVWPDAFSGEAAPVPVDGFTLYSSRLGKEQAVYEREVEYGLLDPKPAAAIRA